MRPIRTVARTVLVLAVGLAPAVPAAVSAAPAPGGYYLQSVLTGFAAAAAGDAVAQHRPKGDEDQQQWSLRADGAAWWLENLVRPGRCLGRAATAPAMLACGDPNTRWEITDAGDDQYAVKDPAADRYLSLTPSGDGWAEGLGLAADGPAARWYLTPLTPVKAALPAEADRTLDQVTFLTAHNAYANGVDGGFSPPIINLFPNQVRGIDRQLADGVRGFMLDLHQTPDGAILCHDSCTLVSRPVALWVDLKRITDFLAAHPTEIVTVFLEDYVAPGVLRAELARVPGLATMLIRPDLDGVRDHGWPRLSELRRRNQRLLIMTDHDRASDQAAGLTRDSFGVQYQREWTVENYWSMGSGAGTSDWSCSSRWPGIPLTRTEPGFRPLFVMNHFRDVTVAATASGDNAKVLNRAERFCAPAARKKPNYIAVDRYDLGTPAAAVAQLNTYAY
ncbi:phospholipase [Actinoplanes oblitus]|uniref:Phospholipase n=1 Tax=Actinoplanes oblitus TaxID=3040509 RepID=A0ABY8WSI3_9ACTN|nr:phospholipase [Actinoplanes oblitus]WIN00433.1 phospholipase [Actinoplanes oblitus]